MTSAAFPARAPLGARHDRISVLDGHRFTIRHGAATRVVHWSDVFYLRAATNLTCFVTADGEMSVRAPITAVVRILAALGCIRIHRGLAVNGTRVRMLVGHGGHRLTVLLDNELRLEVGRRFQHGVRARFGGAGHRRAAIG